MQRVLAALSAAFVLPRSHSPARARVAVNRAYRCTAPVRMPEGPEVTVHAETLNATLRGQQLRGARILSGRYIGNGSVAGRSAPPEGWKVLQDALPTTVLSVHSHGKFMWWRLGPSLTMWSTLGMSGAWSLLPSAHARIGLQLRAADGRDWPLFYNDQRNFGTVTVCSDDSLLQEKLRTLGPSWLAEDGLCLDAFIAVVRRQCATKRSANVAVAKFLMDQRKTAGIG